MLPHYFLLAFTFLLSIVNPSQTRESYKFTVLSASSLAINGSSNVNKFNCRLDKNIGIKELVVNSSASGKVDLKGRLKVKVNDIDCRRRMMNRDFRRTLKSEQYPDLVISFQSFDKNPFNASSAAIKGRVIIELAGVKKDFVIDMQVKKTGSDTFQIKGNRLFQFIDFNLTPPDKLGGLIKVKDAFDVSFELMLKQQI